MLGPINRPTITLLNRRRVSRQVFVELPVEDGRTREEAERRARIALVLGGAVRIGDEWVSITKE